MTVQESPQPTSTSAMAITGFVIGLIALLTSFMPIINNFSFFLGLLALIFSIVGLVGCARGKKKGKGLAIAALIISILSCIVVLWSQSVYSAAIDEATSTTKAAMSTTKASTNTESSASEPTATVEKSSATTSSSAAPSAEKTTSGPAASDENASSEEASTNEDTSDGEMSEAAQALLDEIANSGSKTQYAYQVSIEEITLSETYDGEPCAIITYSFTNNSDETTSFLVAIDDKAYQNGIQLSTGTVSGLDSFLTSAKDVKPGGTLIMQQAYILDDQSDITIECTERWAHDGVILAEATFPVA